MNIGSLDYLTYGSLPIAARKQKILKRRGAQLNSKKMKKNFQNILSKKNLFTLKKIRFPKIIFITAFHF